MLGIFSQMFEVLTFYKPIKALVEEKHRLFISIAAMAAIFIIFAAIIAAFSAGADYVSANFGGAPQGFAAAGGLAGKLAPLPFFFALFLLGGLAGSVAVFAISRLFSKSGTLESLLAVNYFLIAACSMFVLVSFVPFAQFAGMIFLFMGAVLYLYFLNEVFEAMFAVSSGKGMMLLALYLIVCGGMYFALTFALGALKVPIR